MANSEYLSKDILDDKYIKLFAPYHYIQMALGTCRVHIKDKFVSSPTLAQKLYTSCCAVATLALYIYAAQSYFMRYYFIRSLYVMSITIIIISYFTFLFNIVHLRFVNNDTNPKFYVQLQKIDRLMNINENKILNNILHKNNSLSVFVIMMTLSVTFCIIIYGNFSYVIGFTGLLYSVVTCTVEWMYCADLMMYFFIRIRFINAIIQNHLQGNVGPVKSKAINIPTNYFIRCLASETHDFQTNSVDLYVKALFQGFASFQRHYRFQVSYTDPLVCDGSRLTESKFVLKIAMTFGVVIMLLFYIEFVFLTVLTFESGLIALQRNALHWTEFLTLPTIFICNLLMSLFICIRFEVFYRETKRTKRLCVTLMARYCDGPLREKGKRMLKTIEQQPPTFNVYNMWDMDALTVISMLNIVTTIMVALLQFAFL